MSIALLPLASTYWMSELKPTCITSNGVGSAVPNRQGVSTTIAAVFLPETKGNTLDEIGSSIEGGKSRSTAILLTMKVKGSYNISITALTAGMG